MQGRLLSDRKARFNINIKDFGAHSITETGYETFDSTVFIQNALDFIATFGGKVIVDIGTYKITGTLWISSNTILEGLGYASQIVLGDDYELDSVLFRGVAGAYPYICTRENAEYVIVENLRITGNKTQFENKRHFGLGFVDCSDCIAKNVMIDYINYDPTLAETYETMAYGIATMRATNINILGGRFEYGGYESVGIGDDSVNVLCDGIYAKNGWRTSFQVHRGSKNIKLINSIIEETLTTNHATITVHGEVDANSIDDLIIDNCIITETNKVDTTYGAIELVAVYVNRMQVRNCVITAANHGVEIKGTDFYINNCKITAVNNALQVGSPTGAKVLNNIITSTAAAGAYFGTNSALLDCSILANKITSKTQGVSTSNSATLNNFKFNDNEVVSEGNGFSSQASGTGIDIKGNKITSGKVGAGAYAIYCRTGLHSELDISGNKVKSLVQDAIAVGYATATPVDNKMTIKDNIIDAPSTTYAAIEVDGYYTNPTITGNVVLSGALGVKLATAIDTALVTTNDLRRAGTAISDTSSGTNVTTGNYTAA